MKVMNLEGRRYGIIEGENGYIVTEDDFVHGVWYDKSELCTLRSGYSDESVWRKMTLQQMLDASTEVKLGIQDYEFGHYWGIKDRVARNYHGLLRSMREIGADTSKMPKWGA